MRLGSWELRGLGLTVTQDKRAVGFSYIIAWLTSEPGGRATARYITLIGAVGLGLMVWSVLANLGEQAPVSFPSPLQTVWAISDLLAYDEMREERPLLVALLYSLSRMIAWGGGMILLGGSLGVMLGLRPQINAVIAPILDIFSLPPILGILPLLGLVFQGDELTSLLVITVGTALSLSCGVRDALRSVPEIYVEEAKEWGANSFEIMVSILVPLALPKSLLTMTHQVSLFWGYIAVVEYASTNRGLGELIYTARRSVQMEQALAVVLVVITLSYVSYLSMSAICRYVSPWESRI